MKYQLTPNSSFLTFLQRAEEYGVTIETKHGPIGHGHQIVFHWKDPNAPANINAIFSQTCPIEEAVDCLNHLIEAFETGTNGDYYRKMAAHIKAGRKSHQSK